MELASIFQDKCVFQRRRNIKIWGTTENDIDISISFAGKNYHTTAKDKKWCIDLEPMEAAKHQTLTVSSEEGTIVLQDISVGEVWLAGGQSNMELWMHFDKELNTLTDEELRKLDIRMFDYPEVSYEEALEDWDYSAFGYWRNCTLEDIHYYSAVAFWFAKKLYEEIEIPIGIIGCNLGGSKANCWMDEATVSLHGKVWLDEYQKAIENLDVESYKKAYRKNPFSYEHVDPFGRLNETLLREHTVEQQAEIFQSIDFPPMGPYDSWRPCGLYEMMLKPLIPYTLQGVLWYQGESDDVHAEIYKEQLTDLIGFWREKWKYDLPFFIVQLAPFNQELPDGALNGTRFPEIRKAQEEVADTVKNAWLISTSDCGEEFDIHPKRKRPVGERLALQVLKHIYQHDILSESPKCVRGERKENNIYLYFSNSGKELYLLEEGINWLTVEQQTREVPIKELKCEGDHLIVSGDFVGASPIQVKIAQSAYYKMTLYNSADIPAIPAEVVVY